MSSKLMMCFLVVSACIVAAMAHAKDLEDVAMVWYPSAKCQIEPEPGSPGSTPELAIEIDNLTDLFFAAVYQSNKEYQENQQSNEEFEPVCKWVRLKGYFRWLNYYHYMGTLTDDSGTHYFDPSSRFIIEKFGDDSIRRGELQARHVTIVGRFYNLCAAAERAEERSGEDWIIMGGPCHYGDDRGMMLTDVFVEDVHDDFPRYLTGEANRTLFYELPHYTEDDISALKSLTRRWADSIQQGIEGHAERSLAQDPETKNDEGERREAVHDIIVGRDSYTYYLNQNDAFQRLDVEKAPVVVFARGATASQPVRAVGCICMIEDCTDRWPVLDSDADNFLGAAACVDLAKEKEGRVWHWLQ